jgi:CheY-like chemotaxis protein
VEVHFAEDGQQAVDAIRGRAQFDLVLMDLDMPVLDGLGAVKAIRAWEIEHGNPPVPIVGLSANAMREAVRECLDAGCAAHVAKPVDKATLLSTIRRYHRSRVASAPVSGQIAALVPKYLSSKLKQIEEARVNLAASDFEPICRFGHNLKGTGLGYGFPWISVIGAEIEESAMGHDRLSVDQQLKMLQEFLVESPAIAPVDVEVSL